MPLSCRGGAPCDGPWGACPDIIWSGEPAGRLAWGQGTAETDKVVSETPLGLAAQTQPVTPLPALIPVEGRGSAEPPGHSLSAFLCAVPDPALLDPALPDPALPDPAVQLPTAPPGHCCLQTITAHYPLPAEVQPGWILPFVYGEDG